MAQSKITPRKMVEHLESELAQCEQLIQEQEVGLSNLKLIKQRILAALKPMRELGGDALREPADG